MMMKKDINAAGKNILLLAVTAIIIIGTAVFWLFGKNVTVRATLGGEVTAVCTVGAEVREGDTIVKVKGLTGEAVAARATSDGKVTKVMTQVGTTITPKTEVAVIKSK